MYRHGCRFIQCKILGIKMKKIDTMQSYKYLRAIFGDKWVDWGVSVGFLLLIVSWFVPRNTADFMIDFIAGLMLLVVIRIGCVIFRVRRGDELPQESARSVRFREVIGNVVFLSFFVIALLLIAWRYLR